MLANNVSHKILVSQQL